MRITIILFLFIMSCVDKQVINEVSTNKDAAVYINVVKRDSNVYKMVIVNSIDSLTHVQVSDHFTSLIENQKDTVILRGLLESFKEFAGYDYNAFKYGKIITQLEGDWEILGENVRDTINLSKGNFDFRYPNLLAITYNNTLIYFSIKDKTISGNYNDEIVRLTKIR